MLTQLLERWASDKLTVNGRTIHYTRTGGDKPPLLLVHGFTDDGLTWARLAHDLEDRYDVLMPDAYGHGNSARSEMAISFHDMVDDLITALDMLEFPQITALGHSMGAGVVALAAARHPDRFKAVILEDPFWLDSTPSNEEMQGARQQWFDWLSSFQTKSREEATIEIGQTNHGWDPLDIETFAVSRQQVDLRLFERIDWAANHAWQDIIANIECPFLLLSGENELGGLLTPTVVEQVAGLNNQCQTCQVTGTGHHLHRENYPQFFQAINDFLQNIEGG